MRSVKELYKIGYGPSSSHTIGPTAAAQYFMRSFPDAKKYVVTLFGSLAYTGKGHGTDKTLKKVFGEDKTEVVFDKVTQKEHPNAMIFTAVYPSGDRSCEIWSVGGGDIKILGAENASCDVYSEKNFEQIKTRCGREGLSLSDYVRLHEPDAADHMKNVWEAMKASVRGGLTKTGELPGGLKVLRRAKELISSDLSGSDKDKMIAAYAFAVAEQNAAGEMVVTAPTCGSCGVLPATLYYYQSVFSCGNDEIYNALMCAGVIGNVIKHNASISGAECGCQAEIGSACAMAAAAIAYLEGLKLNEIEYCAEMAIEHHLGLTCDPVGGLVQIPCIERNALAAMQAFNFVSIAPTLAKSRKVDFDTIVLTMYETGCDLKNKYRETSIGGLAKHFKRS